MGPELMQHPLVRADGSTVFSDGLFTVVAGVNGPVEVQRRDEIPEEAAIEVNIRPSSGVGGPRERWLEGVVHSVLKSVVLVHLHPRTLIQITLQVLKEPESKLRNNVGDLAILPTLVNSAFMALVDSGLPLSSTMCAVLAVTSKDNKVICAPEEMEIQKSMSIHAMAFDVDGQQLLEQSWGEFELGLWEEVVDSTQRACLAAMAPFTEDTAMDEDGTVTRPWLRQALQDRARKLNSWREPT